MAELTKYGPWIEAKTFNMNKEVTKYTLNVYYDIRDTKRRIVGGSAVVYQYVDYNTNEITTRWGCRVMATRNGCCYGATPRTKVYNDLESAQKAAIKAIEAQQKRYQKKFG